MGLLAGVAVLVIATVAVPRWPPTGETVRSQQPSPDPRESAAGMANPSHTMEPAPHAMTVAPRPVVKTRTLTEAPKKTSVQNATNRTAKPARPTPSASLPSNDNLTTARTSTSEKAVPEPMPATPSAALAANLTYATITGCLEISIDGNEFRLAETEGADAPKSRSWRTGFLRKQTAPVALVGAPDPLALEKSVGKRVAATGQLTNRELQVSSLRVVSPFCN